MEAILLCSKAAENINVLQEKKMGNLKTILLGSTGGEKINTLLDKRWGNLETD